MSAFLVSKKHIDVLVYARSFISRNGATRLASHLAADDLGRMLWRENMLSLNARYKDPIDEAELAAYTYDSPRPIDVVGMIKAVHCYEYQACEHKNWDVSDAKAFCDSLLKELTFCLPGYTEAAWGIE